MNIKRPDPFLVKAVLAAALIVAAALIYANWTADVAALPKQPVPATVFVPASMQACKPTDHCVIVDTACSSCCQYDAINALYADLFKQMFGQNCQSHKGAVCECSSPVTEAACIRGKCQPANQSPAPPQPP